MSASVLSEHPTVAILGAGAVGSAFGKRLHFKGFRVEAVCSRSRESAERLAPQVGAGISTDDVTALPAVDLLFLCIPDDALNSVAVQLADLSQLSSTFVAHTSGAHDAAILEPLAEKVKGTFSFHPMQTFKEGASPDLFEGMYIGVEGEDEAVSVGEEVAKLLGAVPVRVNSDAKALYHLGGVMASNGLVALHGVATSIFEEAGVSSDAAEAMLLQLFRQTLANLSEVGAAEALTGPAVRGDEATLKRHLSALKQKEGELLPLYRELTVQMLHLAREGERLESDEIRRLRAILDEEGEFEDEISS